MRAETKRSRPAMNLLPFDSTLGPLAHARGYKTSLVAKRPKGFMTLRIVAPRVSKGTCRLLVRNHYEPGHRTCPYQQQGRLFGSARLYRAIKLSDGVNGTMVHLYDHVAGLQSNGSRRGVLVQVCDHYSTFHIIRQLQLLPDLRRQGLYRNALQGAFLPFTRNDVRTVRPVVCLVDLAESHRNFQGLAFADDLQMNCRA